MTGHLYEMKRPPTVRAIQFTGDIEEVKEFLLGTESKIYRDFEGDLVVDGLRLYNHEYVIESDNGIEIMDVESFTDRYKRIY